MFQRSPRHTLIALLACICAGPQGAAAHASPPVSLTQLEDRARAFAPSARLAQADVTVAEQRSAALQAGSGAQLFGGAGVDNAREAVTDTLSRDYQRTQMHLGVRWPLLGTRAAQQRTVDDAQHAVEQSRLRRLQMENEAVLAVRRAYVRHLRSVERIRLADAFLRVRAEAQEQLASRHAAGVLLEADRLDLGGLFNIVQATHDSQSAARDLARAEIERLTGQPAAAVQTQEPAWPQTCLAPGAAALDRSPAVTLAQQEVKFSDGAAACVILASGGYPVSYEKGKPISGLTNGQLEGESNITVYHSGTALREDGTLVTNGGRVLGVTATAPRLTAAITQAYAAAEKISFEKLHKRSDIGLRALKALAEKQ